MRILHTTLLAGAVALGISAAATAAPVSFDLEFTGSSVPGTGTVTVDTAGAPTTDPYEFRAGNSFSASFDFGSVTITFSEADALNPVLVPFIGGNPADVNYSGVLDEATGIDLGFISFIDLSMGDGGYSLFFSPTTVSRSGSTGHMPSCRMAAKRRCRRPRQRCCLRPVWQGSAGRAVGARER